MSRKKCNLQRSELFFNNEQMSFVQARQRRTTCVTRFLEKQHVGRQIEEYKPFKINVEQQNEVLLSTPVVRIPFGNTDH